MYFQSLFQKDATPLLRSMSQFTLKRHELLVQDIANIDTPYYRSQKLNLEDFQKTLRKAVDNRNKKHPRQFQIGRSSQVSLPSNSNNTTDFGAVKDSFLGEIHIRNNFQANGSNITNTRNNDNINFKPHFAKNEGIYRYDNTSGSIDKTMADLAQNSLMQRTFDSLLNKKYKMLATAISERV